MGERYLRYTVYQTGESSRYLASLAIADSAANHSLFVLEDGGQLAGYYLGSAQEEGYFLDYVATAPEKRFAGLGTILLDHFHQQSLSRGYRKAVLKVFASNQRAVRWYLRVGYRQTAQSWLCRLRLNEIPSGDPDALTLGPAELTQALQQERALGFSKVNGWFRGAQITLGFIGGHTCKLLRFEPSLVWPLAQALRSTMSASRGTLIVTLAAPPPADWPVMDAEVSLGMLKNLP
jgi:GNAT superfamily N-acetyltransferase